MNRLGGRKFLLAILAMGAIVIMAATNPMAVTTEVVVGILGVLAAFSGSNAVLTMAANKLGNNQPAQQAVEAAPVGVGLPSYEISLPPPGALAQTAELQSAVTNPVPVMPGVVSELENRVNNLEAMVNQLIEIVKQQNGVLNRLTITQNSNNLNTRGTNEFTAGTNKG